MRRQSSATGPVVDYSDYDASTIRFQQHKSERSYFVDPELRSYDDDAAAKKRRPNKNAQFPTKIIFILSQYLIFGGLVYSGWNLKGQLKSVETQLESSKADYDSLRSVLRNTEDQLDKAHGDFSTLKKKLLSINPFLKFEDGVEESDERKKISDTLISRHDTQTQRIDAMQKSIQQTHKRELISRYGEGPYRIEVQVLVQGVEKYFTIELAPVELMPHSVHTFMEMIQYKVWDDTMFIHKVSHVVLAAPIDEEGGSKKIEHAKQLLFPEYSDEFPHEANTIGFQGRPGGPEIYINLDDNSDHHGPGGQKHHDLVEEADPCFGKIVSGLDVLEEFRALNQKAESLGEQEVYYTKIITMKYIGDGEV